MAKKKNTGGRKGTATASSSSSEQPKKRQATETVTSFPPYVVEACRPPKYGAPSPEIVALHPGSVYVSPNFLNSSECQAWIGCAESNMGGFESVCHPATREYAHRECGRIQRNDTNVSDALYERMKPIIDEVASQVGISHFDQTYAPVSLNHNIRLYKYTKGQSFGRHFDGSDTIGRFPNGHTEMTVLIYLSSCQGGATRFYLPTESNNKKKKRKQQTDDKAGVAFVPQQGAVLLHVHGDRCLEHEADPVLDGVKYILRTDVVYGTSA